MLQTLSSLKRAERNDLGIPKRLREAKVVFKDPLHRANCPIET